MKKHLEEEPELELSDDYFEMIALKTAVWDYIVDHAKAIPGTLRAHVVFKDKEDFWRRIRARKYGDYRKEDEFLLRDRAVSKQKRLIFLEGVEREKRIKDRRLDRLRRGNRKERLRYRAIVFLRRLLDRLTETP